MGLHVLRDCKEIRDGLLVDGRRNSRDTTNSLDLSRVDEVQSFDLFDNRTQELDFTAS